MAKRGRVKRKTRRAVKVPVKSDKRKTSIVLKNILLFVVLCVVSVILYTVSTNEIYINLFLLLAIIFGFISVAFVIVYLVLLMIKGIKQ